MCIKLASYMTEICSRLLCAIIIIYSFEVFFYTLQMKMYDVEVCVLVEFLYRDIFKFPGRPCSTYASQVSVLEKKITIACHTQVLLTHC
jgi:hypothetical protein